ncbi:MAG TPA: cation:proton antiporter, partial [Elusimicrobiota bacterium]|nr:cation:proton antiporter [Elusimicrobiota bacterium]
LAMAGLILAVATVGKVGGSTAAARFAGMRWRDSFSIGALMNTRGLMELVVLNIALDMGIISAPLFTMLVFMAVATTFMTGPVLSWLTKGVPREAAEPKAHA